MKYLTEKILGEFLREAYPSHEFVHDKSVPDSGMKRRPDYRNDELMIIVEFDGYAHYTQACKIITEEYKNTVYTSMGYKVIRVPYFIQLSKETIKILFDLDINYTQEYPHGFIDSKCILPCDFCELGVHKFKNELERFSNIKQDIIKSLVTKVEISKSKYKVLPPSLLHILN